MSTLQLDFLLPSRFELKYVDENGEQQMPVLIHRGLIGTYERFIATLLEQTKGNLPYWLSPRQVTIIPISDDQNDYCQKLYEKLLDKDINVNVDLRNERINKKIRDAQLLKTKYLIIIGKNEIENNVLAIREYGSEKTETMTLPKFLSLTKKLIKNHK